MSVLPWAITPAHSENHGNLWKQCEPPNPLAPQPSRNFPAAQPDFSGFGLFSYIAKHVALNDKHLFHDRNLLCCFVAFPICSRKEN